MVAVTWKLASCLALVSSALADSIIERQPHAPVGKGEKRLTFNETSPSTSFKADSVSVRWLSGSNDGDYIINDKAKGLVRANIATNESSIFLGADKIPKDLYKYTIAQDLSSVLFATNSTPLYRYSFDANYFLLDVKSGQSKPLVADQGGDIQDATLAPDGKTIGFVRGNNVHIREANGDIHRITENGGPDQFNGIADWVYEEEIIRTRTAFWFSPDSKYAVYLSINETGVQSYSVPFYTRNASGSNPQEVAPAYPRTVDIRYPKVNSTNPVTRLNLLNVETKKVTPIEIDGFGDESIIGEVAWVTDDHSKFIYRVYNRIQDKDKHVVVDVASGKSNVVRSRSVPEGWFRNEMRIRYVGNVEAHGNKPYYVDFSDEDGWMHIYLFPVDGGKPVQLTKGEWEVRSILAVDAEREVVQISAAKRHSTESHLYTVGFDQVLDPVVDDTVPAFWDASYSAKGGYYILSYQGPDVPYQEVYHVDKDEPIKTLTTNTKLYNRLQEYNLPNITYFELKHPSGFTMNVLQALPPNFDPSKKYPVLFHPYGGPTSQQVTKKFPSYDWTMYLTSDPEMNFIVYVVDNRGTGLKGSDFRNVMAGKMGQIEPEDQIWAAKELIAKNTFLDTNHFGMWGWSHGGFVTAKTVEYDSGVFTFALITAPVTDFRLYDSMFTERYMKTLDGNADGYKKSDIRNMDGFRNIKGGVAITYGSADDNVHPQNAKILIDRLVGAKIPVSKVRMFEFTDSNHGISYNNAPYFHYKFLSQMVWDELQRTEKKIVHQWSKKWVA
ncbi:hypothetical protein VHEMI08318 [[Torrubiella] hemipterigena]|uniref:Probable dipeptidyl-aminopeptidase B n=1 Tax=[Torrubiella] hemipterigena TaxID=1531966 RepID=A0A0A1TD61_9HYPO|nr:hypothetical protein VHEMI08318 [[Torrubiella] hemipterigena]